MKPPKNDLTKEFVDTILDYNPDTGILTWKIFRGFMERGKEAGIVSNRGYRHISIRGSRYLGHRLAWLITYGEWPPGNLDHKNLNRLDNRLENLRLADPSSNRCNTPLHKGSRTGVKGVLLIKGKYYAQVVNRGVLSKDGPFTTVAEAEEVVRAMRIKLHGEFARHG